MAKQTQWNLTPKAKSETNKNSGFILALALIIATIAAIVSVGLISVATIEYNYSDTSYKKDQALNLADAGIDKAVKEITANANYTGTGSTPIALTNGELDIAVATNGNTKTITSTGYIPNKAHYKIKKITTSQLSSTGVTVTFQNAAQVGSLGITMNANSVINGDIYSNANIVGYKNSDVNGDAYAVGTISSSRPTISGDKHPGSPASTMPTIDYAFWKNQAASGGTQNGNLELNSGSYTMGPKKIVGNLTMNSNSVLTLNGPLYITGSFEMNQNAKIYMNNSFGSNGTVFIVDGSITINANSYVYPTNSSPKGYLMMISLGTASNTIELNSNATNGIVCALNGGIQFDGNSKVMAAISKQLTMNSNGEIDYDPDLANAQFSSGGGGGGTWTLQKGTWIEK